MRRRIRITESQLRRTVNEAVRGLLKEDLSDAEALKAKELIAKDGRVPFQNACDDLYYGYGFNQFMKDHKGYGDLSDEDLKLIWNAAFDWMAEADDLCDKYGKPIQTYDYDKFYDIKYGGEVPRSAMYDDDDWDDDWDEEEYRKQEIQDTIDDILENGVIPTKIDVDDEPGSCAVYVETKDGTWGEWVDVWIDDKYNDVRYDWNDMYMDDIKKNSDVFEVATDCAVYYAEEKGIIVNSDDGWIAGNTNESRMRRKRRR